jgi:Zn-dependent protease/CBS domain-containing protein
MGRTPVTPARGPTPSRATGFRLGKVLGFEIRVDLSWFVIFFLVFWSLSEGVFPDEYAGLGRLTYLTMGLVGTLLFFASLLAHELSHAVVSRRKGIPVEGITLFIFGGMALTRREPDSAKDELLIAGVGPLASLVLAACFELLSRLAPGLGFGVPVVGVADYLAFINAALAIFNLMPGFPMDGGRVFRAIAWSLTRDRMKATRWAVTGGRAFGTALMVIGAVQALAGSALGGLWLVFIGWFLRSLAGSSLQQQAMRDVLRRFVASDLMSPRPEVVPAHLPVAALVQDHFMQLRYGSYPVMEGDRLAGLVTLEGVKRIPRSEWGSRTAADAMRPLAECAVVAPHASLELALEEMGRGGVEGRALVVDRGHLVGIISASDVTRWLHRLQLMEHLVGRAP